MNLKRWAFLFGSTLLVGAVFALISGGVMQFSDTIVFKGTQDFFMNLLLLAGTGIMVSVYAQLGFFAYLMLNYMAAGVFSQKTWEYIQIVLTALALMELMFFRSFVDGSNKGYSDLILALIILVVAIGVAYFKVKATNASAWIPTLFFMIAGAIVEIVGVLRIQDNNATILIAVPLIACNAFQMMQLHRLVRKTNVKNAIDA
ncbi:KinB signaling pathway activation protein [Paenibacillus shirakamiensis]|uniref:KinB signaling pathway activation protein n=1 Tax=Paenibacillus shirakamiensis TaxID=1265935 RepID=A0ABS4JLT4_9BACL|nr:KinB-signaling pathway activation protein [Paenibacillus shirakamiensis]MBP2002674.1 KinB signaling pathway activation protein [Paenibacillus shirakamiensis]